MGWASKKNGELLQLATGRFDVFMTIDQNLIFQQNLSRLTMAIVLISTPSNRFRDLAPLVPAILKALEATTIGSIIRVP